MARLTIGLGAILIALGVAGYLGTGRDSITALIPSFLGAVLVILGLIAAVKPSARRHAMHAAAVVALLGLAGSLMRPLRALGSDDGLTIDTPVIMQFLTAALCLV